MLGGIHTHKPHLAPYYEADGFHVLGPGAPLDLELRIGRLRYPAESAMRHLVRPLARRSPTCTASSAVCSPAAEGGWPSLRVRPAARPSWRSRPGTRGCPAPHTAKWAHVQAVLAKLLAHDVELTPEQAGRLPSTLTWTRWMSVTARRSADRGWLAPCWTWPRTLHGPGPAPAGPPVPGWARVVAGGPRVRDADPGRRPPLRDGRASSSSSSLSSRPSTSTSWPYGGRRRVR